MRAAAGWRRCAARAGPGASTAAPPPRPGPPTAATAAAAIAAPAAIEATALPAFGEAAAAAAPVIGAGDIATTSASVSSAPVSSAPVAPVDATSSVSATDAAAPTAIAPTTAEAPVDSSTEELAKTGTTTAGPGGQADPNYQSTSPAGGFKPYTGPTGADISGALKSLGVTPFQAAGLGLSAYGQYKSAQNQKSLQDQLNQQAQLTRPAAQELMSQYQSGTIGAAQEKQIADYTNQQKATIKQRYAKMGRDPNYDSAAQQEMANVDVQAASMRDTALQNVLSSGLKASGVTAGPAQQAIMAGYQQDQAAQKAQADFLAALANMQARGSGSPTTPAVPV